jgi:predicted amidohydrolase
MARHLKIAAAQLGTAAQGGLARRRRRRLDNLLKEAHGMGAKFVVFPELAFTTFFPRWWMEDQQEVDSDISNANSIEGDGAAFR